MRERTLALFQNLILYSYSAGAVILLLSIGMSENASIAHSVGFFGMALLWAATCWLNWSRSHYTFYVMALAFTPIALSILYNWYRRLQFVVEHGGMDCADCNSSPMAFLIGVVFESMIFWPGAIGLFLIYRRYAIKG